MLHMIPTFSNVLGMLSSGNPVLLKLHNATPKRQHRLPHSCGHTGNVGHHQKKNDYSISWKCWDSSDSLQKVRFLLLYVTVNITLWPAQELCFTIGIQQSIQHVKGEILSAFFGMHWSSWNVSTSTNKEWGEDTNEVHFTLRKSCKIDIILHFRDKEIEVCKGMLVQRWNMMRQILKRKFDSRYFIIGVCNLMPLFCWVLLFINSSTYYILHNYKQRLEKWLQLWLPIRITLDVLKERKQMMVLTMMQVAKTMRTTTTMTCCWENSTLSLNLPHMYESSSHFLRNETLHIPQQFLRFVSIQISSSIHSSNYYLSIYWRPSPPQV